MTRFCAFNGLWRVESERKLDWDLYQANECAACKGRAQNEFLIESVLKGLSCFMNLLVGNDLEKL